MRVILDTNILLSGLAYPTSAPGRIVSAWRAGSVEVVLSEYVLEELARVLPRLQHRHGLTELEQRDLVDSLAMLADVHNPPEVTMEELRDAADLPVLALLVHGDAEVLVTGDKDLLVLADRFPILTAAEFCRRYGV